MDGPGAQARPLVLLQDADLQAARRHLLAAATAWCAEWSVRMAGLAVSCRAATAADRSGEWSVPRCGERGAWLQPSPGLADHIGLALLGREAAQSFVDDSASPIVRELAGAAEQALLAALAASPQDTGDPGPASASAGALGIPPASWFDRHAGTVVAELRAGPTLLLRALLRLPPRAKAPTRRRADLQPLSQALSRLRVRVTLVAGELPLALGELENAAIDDVLRLPARVDQPMRVDLDDGTPVCRAFVGLQAQQLAMRVTSLEGRTEP